MHIARSLAYSAALAVPGLLAQSAGAASIIGYSGGTTDNAYINSTPVTMSAGDARAEFLGALSGYYYEDFQEIPTKDASKTFTKLGLGGGYTFQWKSSTLNVADAPSGTLTTGDPTKTLFRTGPVSSARGAFDTYDNTLASATGGNLLDSQNSYVDILPGTNDYNVTININPGQDAVGLMLNDVLQPNKIDVLVTFMDGSTIDTSDNLQGLTLNKHGVLVPTTLSNNNDWFLGVIGNTPISSITIDETHNGTPITLDNIYVGNVSNIGDDHDPVVPVPASAIGGGALLGILAVCRARRRALHA